VPGLLEGRPAILVLDQNDAGAGATYFMLLRWSTDKVTAIRDVRHAACVIDDAEFWV
jgi:RNA polymerase sigma-70 factor, ECF subfamily